MTFRTGSNEHERLFATILRVPKRLHKKSFFFRGDEKKLGFFGKLKWSMDPLHVPNEANWALKVFDPFVHYSFITGISDPIPDVGDCRGDALRSCSARLRLRRAAWRAHSLMWRAAWCLRR